jgi:hypothetical protein
MHSQFLFLALDLARERSADADRQRLATRGRLVSSGPGRFRRLVARTAIAVARSADEATLQRTSTAS